jgi:hypothetical protein
MPSYEPPSAFTKQDEFWKWTPPEPDGSGSYNFINFMLRREMLMEKNEDRFRAQQAQRDFHKNLVPDTSPKASMRNFERVKAIYARHGKRFRPGFTHNPS